MSDKDSAKQTLTPRAWLRVSNISNQSRGVFETEDVELRSERLDPLYALTREEVAAVNKLRARREWMSRATNLCRCDHNEYCQHCYPESFRPGGVWHGLGA